jgi:chromosome segregation ATPase
MSLSSRSTPPVVERAEPELDSTAELPVLDAAATAAQEHPPGRTDTWVMPPPTREALTAAAGVNDEMRQLEASLRSVSVTLRETQELLATRGERLAQLEREREEARAALAAAEQRSGALTAELGQQQAAAAQQALQLAEARQAITAAEERSAAAERRAAALAAQLEQREADAARHAVQLEESRQAHTTAEQRARQLERRLEEHADEQRTQRSQELEQQQAQAARNRAQAASLMEDLHYERARAMSYFESLQTAEGRRLIAEGLVVQLQQEVDAHAHDAARLGRELTGRDSQARERDAELAQRAARVARLEQQLSAFTAALAERDTQLRDARQEAQALQSGLTRVEAEMSAGAERLRTHEELAEQHRAVGAQQQGELQRLLSERTDLSAALATARAEAAAAATQSASLQATGAAAQERVRQLEAALGSEQQRVTQLDQELTKVRGEMEAWGGALRSVQQEREGQLARHAAAEERARLLEQQAEEQREALQTLQSQCDAHAARARELEGDLRAAEDTVHRLESEGRSRNARIEELEKSNREWRTAAEEARHVSSDTAANPVLREAARQLADAPLAAAEPAACAEPAFTAEPLPDGATRLLIHKEGGREIVHVLGRKTSIGRTPDNDLQIDAKFVSRHHAVILVGPSNTIIEDLNSTNGVLVNGRRITRHTLREGDQIAIGRSHYRFALRRSADKR